MPDDMSVTQEKPLDRLTDELSAINRTLHQQNALRVKFFQGLALGLGSALGASIIAAAVILTLTQMLQALGLDIRIESPNPLR
jgi:hypothetical protein